ncbi:MAG: Tic20 family protein [Prochlorococcus sp.]|jgi:hypothetical protein|nr:hypothetical protein [Prochlorococcaceae cyanobacterium ETNP18_MAG_14]
MLIPIWQRLLGVLVYMLPWSDAIPFGKNLLAQVPVVVLRALLLPAMPIWIVQNAIPLKLGSLVLFLVLFLAVVRNPNVPYFLRFNTLQALLLSIILSLLGLVFFEILQKPLEGTLIFNTLATTVLVAVFAIVIFALIECLRGREPDLPGISQAVRMQLY